MITVLALAFASTQAAPDLADYFPVAPGSKWVYQETMKDGKSPNRISVYTDTAGAPSAVGEMTGVPITTSSQGSEQPIVTFYNVTNDSVDLVFAYDVKVVDSDKKTDTSDQNGGVAGAAKMKTEHYLINYPVLKVGDGKEEWSYTGKTIFLGDPVDMIMSASSRHTGKKKYLNQTVDTVEVKMTTYINAVPDNGFGSMKDATIKSESTSVYAKGLGLVEYKEHIELGKSKIDRTRKLVSFTPGTQ